MAGHAQLQFVTTECSKTQIRLTQPNFNLDNYKNATSNESLEQRVFSLFI